MFRIIFLLLFSISASAQDIYKTPSGAKYHLSTCRSVKNVSQKITHEEAIEFHLTPCLICKPENIYKGKILPVKSPQGEGQTTQCKGKTKAGSRCKHMTRIGNGYCFQHQPG